MNEMPRGAAIKLTPKIHTHCNAKWGTTTEKDQNNTQRTG